MESVSSSTSGPAALPFGCEPSPEPSPRSACTHSVSAKRSLRAGSTSRQIDRVRLMLRLTLTLRLRLRLTGLGLGLGLGLGSGRLRLRLA